MSKVITWKGREFRKFKPIVSGSCGACAFGPKSKYTLEDRVAGCHENPCYEVNDDGFAVESTMVNFEEIPCDTN